MAEKKNAKAKAGQNSLTKRTKAKHSEMTAQNLESAQSRSQRPGSQPRQTRTGERHEKGGYQCPGSDG
jgi:hypothetical protein